MDQLIQLWPSGGRGLMSSCLLLGRLERAKGMARVRLKPEASDTRGRGSDRRIFRRTIFPSGVLRFWAAPGGQRRGGERYTMESGNHSSRRAGKNENGAPNPHPNLLATGFANRELLQVGSHATGPRSPGAPPPRQPRQPPPPWLLVVQLSGSHLQGRVIEQCRRRRHGTHRADGV